MGEDSAEEKVLLVNATGIQGREVYWTALTRSKSLALAQ